MTQRLPRRSIRQCLLITLVALLLLGLLVSLASWQFNRALYKQTLLDQEQARKQHAPVALTIAIETLIGNRYLPVQIDGKPDLSHQILLDNQILNGQAGYSVLLPVRLQSGGAVLVNRGWVPSDGRRQQLPAVQLAVTELSVLAYLDAFPVLGLELDGADSPTPGWPTVVQTVNTQKLGQVLGYDLLPYQAVLKPGQPASLTPMPSQPSMGPDKHYGYAAQWAALAFTLVLLYGWYLYRFVSPRNDESQKSSDG